MLLRGRLTIGIRRWPRCTARQCSLAGSPKVGEEVVEGTSACTSSDGPLTDTFGRFHSYLRISLTEKCNLRCVYCMPAEGVKLTPREKLMTLDERKRVVDLFANLGINKVRFTGGEPTVSKDLLPLIETCTKYEGIKSIGMTTNAIMLTSRYLDDLKAAGLNSVNISLDSLNADRFALMSRRDKKGLMKVLSAIFSAVAKGLKVKVNCVIMRGVNDDEMTQFIEMTKDMSLDVRFIELMPFDGNEWSATKVVIEIIGVTYSNYAMSAVYGVQRSCRALSSTGIPSSKRIQSVDRQT
jgi:cyclic pyranopterin phosphate synthase